MFTYWAVFIGDNFYPRNIDFGSHIKIVGIFEPGDERKSHKKISSSGVDQLYDYGCMRIESNNLLELLESSEQIRAQAGSVIESIQIHVLYYYEGQCNLEFNAAELKKIVDLGAVLTISCDTQP